MSTVCSDFLLDPQERLTDQERAVMTGMLSDLLCSIAEEIAAPLSATAIPANDFDGQQLLRQLAAEGRADTTDLVARLLRQADEHRIETGVRDRSGATALFLQALLADGDRDISTKAMALILGRGRRRDRHGQRRIEFDDLPRLLAHDLAHAVAAMMRSLLPPAERASLSDLRMESAAAGLAARHDGSKGIDFILSDLVGALANAGKLEDGLLAAASEECDAAFLAHALASRAGIDPMTAWDLMLDARGGGFALLLRMAQVSRDSAARLLADLSDSIGLADPGREIARFSDLEDHDVESERQWLSLDPAYRSSLQALGVRHG